jgi:tetratricopeptide (TPR) repeat protein
MADALACFTRAAEMGTSVRADALYALAVVLRRLRRYEAAATVWEQLLYLDDCPSRLERDAADALAVHHEHRLRSLQSARGLAMRSLLIDSTATRREATEHRLARLDRKLSRTEMPMAALF